MKFLKNTKLILILILLLAAFLRLPLLDQLPSGITIDEAGQGYSAYSILKTGRDEWGDFLPLNPRGFGDYKPPVFMYVLVPSVAIFGLNEFAIRFPSAIAGILTVLVIFFLVRDLFKNRNLGLLASFFMAIAPWHVYYSRLGWESNIGLLFFCLGIWLFISSTINKNRLALSVLFFGLSALSYHSFKLISPLMFFALWFIYKKELKFSKNSLIASIVVGAIFIGILGYGFLFSGASRRVEDQFLFNEKAVAKLREEQFNDKAVYPFNRVFNNKYFVVMSKMTDNYTGYFSLPFLFGPHRSEGSILNFPTQGLLYVWQLPILLFGIFYLIRNFSFPAKVLFSWLFIAPVAASLTQDYMHAGRAQAIFPVLTIISVIGLVYIFNLITNEQSSFPRNKKFRQIALICASLIIFGSVILRIDKYMFNTFNTPHGGLVSGYKEIINYTEKNKPDYGKIFFTKANSEPQAFIAFYTKWDPADFQRQSQSWKKFETEGKKFLDMSDYGLDKYVFVNTDISRDKNIPNALIIGTDEEIAPDIKPIYSVADETGKIIFVVVKTDEIPK